MKNIRFFSIWALVALFTSQVSAQRLVGTSGGTASGGNAYISYSIGESITGTAGSAPALTIGFQQPSTFIITALKTDADPQVSVYPNPARDFIVVKAPYAVMHIVLYDTRGRIIHDQLHSTSTGQVELDASQWTSGNYILRAMSADQHMIYGQFKVIKL